jgi:hypothetical protein
MHASIVILSFPRLLAVYVYTNAGLILKKFSLLKISIVFILQHIDLKNHTFEEILIFHINNFISPHVL